MAQQLQPKGGARKRRDRKNVYYMAPDVVDSLPWVETPESSNVGKIAWYGEALFVVFGTGKIYRYESAEKSHFDALVEAHEDERESVGKAFHRTVKQGGLEYARVCIQEKEE